MTEILSAALAVADVKPAAALVSPALLFVLCIAGAVGMTMLLPGRMEVPWRKMAGVLLLVVLIVLATRVGRAAAGIGVYFWIFSAIALVGAVKVITHTKPVYSALYFVLTVMATAGLFVLMWAEFMAAALVLIYAGAILVTYVFVIMLAAEAQPVREDATEAGAEHDVTSREPIVASAVGIALVGVLLFVIFDRAPADVAKRQAAATQPVLAGATQQLGVFLFDRQLVNLELAGLILTVAMVGAIAIARRRVWRPQKEFEAPAERIIAPATPVDDNPHSIPVVGTENPRQKAYPET